MKLRVIAAGALFFSFFASQVFALDKAAEDLMNAGHFKRARAIAQHRLQANPNDADAFYVLARVNLAQDYLDQAQALAERAIEIAPNSSEAHRVLGESLGLKAIKVNLVTGLAIARRGKKEGERDRCGQHGDSEPRHAIPVKQAKGHAASVPDGQHIDGSADLRSKLRDAGVDAEVCDGAGRG